MKSRCYLCTNCVHRSLHIYFAEQRLSTFGTYLCWKRSIWFLILFFCVKMLMLVMPHDPLNCTMAAPKSTLAIWNLTLLDLQPSRWLLMLVQIVIIKRVALTNCFCSDLLDLLDFSNSRTVFANLKFKQHS